MGANAWRKGLLGIAALGVVALLAMPLEDARETTAEAPARTPPASLPPSDTAVATASPATVAAGGPDAGVGVAQASGSDSSEQVRAPPPYPVDVEHLRARLPGNLYWELGVPTRDPQQLRRRAEEEQRWNELFGKIQSNTASEEEIRSYYDRRRRISEDFIAFASAVLGEYGDRLPERDRGLYELSIRMHRTRLEELPRQQEDALARGRAHERRREEWLRGGRGN